MPKITSANLCKSVYDIIHYLIFIYRFEPGKCGKKGKKIQKFEYLKKENSFSDKMKRFFLYCLKSYFLIKNKQ